MPIMGLEWIWIVLIVIIFLVGPKKLPEVAKAMGRAMGEFQKARQQIDTEFKSASQQVDTELKSATQAVSDPLSLGSDSKPTESDSKPTVSDVTDRKKLFDAAQALGVFPYGKTNEELSQLIKEKVDEKKEPVQIVQEGGQQAVREGVKKGSPKSGLSSTKRVDKKKVVGTRKKTSGRMAKTNNLERKDAPSKAPPKEPEIQATSEPQPKKSPRNRKTRAK